MSFSVDFYEAVNVLNGNPNFRRFIGELTKRRDVLLDKTLSTSGEHLFRLQGRCLELNAIINECATASDKLKTSRIMEKTYG